MKKMIRNLVGAALLLSTVYLAGCSDEAKKRQRQSRRSRLWRYPSYRNRLCGGGLRRFSGYRDTDSAGSNPGNYEPTAQEMEAFGDAALYFSIGVATEEANILPNAGDVKVVPLEDEVAAVYADRTFASGGKRSTHLAFA